MAWIRSQDGETLLNVKSVWVELVTRFGVTDLSQIKEHRLKAETHPDTKWSLGIFPTKEAALEELDCIERWIHSNVPGAYKVKNHENNL